MSNDFLRQYEKTSKDKGKKKKPPSRQIAIRIPYDVYEELEELSKKKGEKISKTVIKALRYALNLPD